MRVLIAPDCFGGSLTAPEAAGAIAAGWRRGRPGDALTLVPQSDGGPGFVDVLAASNSNGNAERRFSRVRGPLNDEVEAAWLFDADSATAYLECAQACGLTLLGGPPNPQTAMDAHSGGVGQLMDAALRAGASTVVVGLGGSACTDGGRGMVEALGGLAAARARFSGVGLVVATDVEHPLLGPTGAARVFGPQKGADPQTVERLERRLTAWSDELDDVCINDVCINDVNINTAAGQPISAMRGAGAAGGLGAALLALGGRRESGAAVIAERTGLARAVAAADLLVTGEGRLDDQSPHGKVVGALARAARRAGAPVLVLAGLVTLDRDALDAAGITAAYSVSDYAGSVDHAIDDAARQLTGLAARVAGELAMGE